MTHCQASTFHHFAPHQKSVKCVGHMSCFPALRTASRLDSPAFLAEENAIGDYLVIRLIFPCDTSDLLTLPPETRRTF